jgi:broad specificity phosphatase PhoE
MDGHGLTPDGLKRSNEIGAILRTIPNITGLYASPLWGPIQTAACIFDVADQDLKLRTEPLLANRGTSESWKSLQGRMINFAESLKFDGINIAVTHIPNIVAIVKHVTRTSENTEHDYTKIDEGTFTVIDFENYWLKAVNLTKIAK